MKRFFAVLTAVVLALSLCSGALAAEDVPVIAPNPNTQSQDALASAKAALPYPGGVNVWLGGRFMTFTDAAPAVRDGRTQVPFRAVLEALGAEVAYEDGKISAVFKDGGVMNLAIGSTVMTYTKGDKVKTVQMDVAPYVDSVSGRTYVPVRFVGETLGLTVTWNSELQVAYIVDWNTLVTEIDSHFTNFNAMMTATLKAQIDNTKTYKSNDKISLKGTLEGQSTDPFEVSLTGESLTNGKNSSGSYTLGVDMGGYQPVIAAMGEDTLSTIKALNGQKIDMIFNMENGTYLKSQLLTTLTGGLVPEGAWLSAGNPGELYSQMGIDMDGMMDEMYSGSFTMGSLIRMLCENGNLGQTMGYMAPDSAAQYFTLIYEGMFGNDAVKVATSGSTTTYTCKSDEASLFKGLIDAGMITAEEVKAENITFDFQMTVIIRSDKLVSSTAKMDMQAEGIKMTMNVTGTTKKAEGNITITVAGTGAVVIDIDSTISETTEKVTEKPASGDQIVELQELVNMFLSSLATPAA
ncbi:MAG: copper amine oxidase N-terminal domain-containing protein [Clostridiaceae bacterium]|nr:copper amine oxidase N-terminal domain-containing protein [Clostridiaceae bacterium]